MMARTALQAGPDAPGPAASVELTRLYAAHGRDVLAYALRRAPSAEDAADVVADTFLVTWRRLTEVPPEPEARLWLYGVARHTLANQRRGEKRQTRLAERLRAETRTALSHPPRSEHGDAILAALATLAADDRELLLLIGWEELSPAQAAKVLEISAVAARGRLHRARRRLRDAIADNSRPTALHTPEARMEEAR
jgi:RNA polymerase sigma-70 factor (ECF subfamily)